MMTNEGVLRRWSRRKQAAKAEPPASPLDTIAALEPAPSLPEPAPPELPDIKSLGVASDYTAFLQTGVTAAVQQLALRRAWETDERIAGFRGMAEYAWDFNAPSYGRLWPADDVGQLLRAVLEPPAEDPPAVVEPAVAVAEKPQAEPDTLASGPAEPGLLSEAEASPETGGVRRHGSALPC
jgi:hypothetical protein